MGRLEGGCLEGFSEGKSGEILFQFKKIKIKILGPNHSIPQQMVKDISELLLFLSLHLAMFCNLLLMWRLTDTLISDI